MSDFVHLHVHSDYSLLDGMAKIPSLVNKARELKMPALALTDHGVMYGAFKFFLACKEAGIKPIIGMEAYITQGSRFTRDDSGVNKRYHLLLLAKNIQGYKNLMQLTTKAHLEGYYYKPRVDKELLNRYKEGLIILSGCLQGEIPKALLEEKDELAEKLAKDYLDLAGKGNFYIELQHHPKIKVNDSVNKKLIALAHKLGLPLVATNDVHYINADDAQAHETLLCIQTQRTILEKNRPLSMIDSPDFYLRTAAEMKALFAQYPDALKNTLKIAQECNVEIPYGKWILPKFPLPEGVTPEQYLRELVYKRSSYRFKLLSEEIKKRIDYELNIICNKGFATYFLIVADFVNWAKEQGIRVGPGRGSVAGSLVSFILRITSIDPLKLGLPFERFLSPDRPSPPDIDLDFADDKRDLVIDYVTKKYGNDRVAQIITFGTMEARAVVRDVGRALGMPYAQPDRIAKMIPPGAQGFAMTITKAIDLSVDLKRAYTTEEDTKRLLDLARRLEGVSRHASTHAAGVVIADQELTAYTPLQREVKGERIVTQYDMYSLDLNAAPDGKAIGLLKMDFLGLRNLTILQNAINFVKKYRGIDIDLSSIDRDDKRVYELIQSGETTGVFQLESGGMRRLARDLKPTKFTDIAAMVALFRPGPMDWIPEFIASKENPKKIKYPHEELKSILSETYGIAVYQEQCMQIANVMAGYTMAEADGLRKAIGKKKPELMKKEKIKFIKGCLEKGHNKVTAEKVFSLIEQFVGYGFNKAHSASYGLVAYQTAYMKTHYPIEFMTAVLNAESAANGAAQKEEKLAQAVEECRRMNIDVLPPDINKSDFSFTIEKDPVSGKENIRFALSAVKNVGSAALTSIFQARKDKDFTTLTDLCSRVDNSKVNKKVLESLIKVGALDKFGPRAALLIALPEISENVQRAKKNKSSGQFTLFDDEDNGHAQIEKLPQVEEFTTKESLVFEKELLGFYLTQNPHSALLEKVRRRTNLKIKDLDPRSKRGVVIGGVITQVKNILTKANNSEMAFVRLDDGTGSCELVVFPTIYAKTKNIWINDRVVIVLGKVNSRNDRLSVLVDKVSILTQ